METGARSITQRLSGVFTSESSAAYRTALVVLCLVVAAEYAMVLATGCAPQGAMAWDSISLLDGAWRTMHGQVPHRDYYIWGGELAFLIGSWTMQIVGMRAAVLAYSPLMLLGPLTLLMWWVARRRVPAFGALVLGLLAATEMGGQTFPGGPFFQCSYAMQYNRYGWTMYCVLAVAMVFASRREAARRWMAVEDAAVGMLLGGLLFIKVSYFAVGAGTALLGMVMQRSAVRRVATVLLGMVGAGVLIAWSLHFDAGAFVGDIRMQAQVYQGSLIHSVLNLLKPKPNLLSLGLLAVMAGIGCWNWMRESRSGIGLADGVRFVLLVGAGLAICAVNQQSIEIPTWVLAGVFAMEVLRRRRINSRPSVAAGVLVLGLAAPFFINDGLSMPYALIWKLRNGSSARAARLDSTALSGMICPVADHEGSCEQMMNRLLADPQHARFLTAGEFACWFNDGLALLKRHAGPGSVVVSLEHLNLFAVALGLPSPRHDAFWWHERRTVDDAHHPAARAVLNEADFVMEPKVALSPGSAGSKKRAFSGVLASDFQRVDESALWILHARRGAKPVDATAAWR